MGWNTRESERLALKVGLIYLAFGCLWILVSDKVVHLLITDRARIEALQTFKGVFFVLLSALLIFFVVRSETLRRIKKDQALDRLQAEAKERAIRASEEERNRISSELHDGIQQELAGISLMIERMKEEADERDLEPLQEQIRSCIEEIRSISHDLSSFRVEQKGLKEAIDCLPSVNKNGKEVEFHHELGPLEDRPLSYFTSLNLFRITQELLLNISKHSNAERIHLNIEEWDGSHYLYRFQEDAPRQNEGQGIGFGEHSLLKRIDCLEGEVLSFPTGGTGMQEFSFTFRDPQPREELEESTEKPLQGSV